ncbi:MAG: hypothetical protein HOV81_43095 [Kofleriaceae bacterium]|nr:hypothetical protein [Kofleriaceae bacterium]
MDAARGYVPTSFGCVLDAATTSEAAAAAIGPKGTTVVVVTRAHVACPTLSHVASDLWVATVGAGAPASKPEQSVLRDPQWSRARDYLVRDALVVAGEQPGRRVLAVAQASPFDAWLAIDGLDVDRVSSEIAALTTQLRAKNSSLVTRLHTDRKGAQVVVRIDKLEVDDLVALANEASRLLDPVTAKHATFTCPPPSAGIKSCVLGTTFVVSDMKLALAGMTFATTEPAVANGEVEGLRLTADAAIVLRRGDVILGVDTQRVTSMKQLSDLLASVGPSVTLAVRRDGVDSVLRISRLD